MRSALVPGMRWSEDPTRVEVVIDVEEFLAWAGLHHGLTHSSLVWAVVAAALQALSQEVIVEAVALVPDEEEVESCRSN